MAHKGQPCPKNQKDPQYQKISDAHLGGTQTEAKGSRLWLCAVPLCSTATCPEIQKAPEKCPACAPAQQKSLKHQECFGKNNRMKQTESNLKLIKCSEYTQAPHHYRATADPARLPLVVQVLAPLICKPWMSCLPKKRHGAERDSALWEWIVQRTKLHTNNIWISAGVAWQLLLCQETLWFAYGCLGAGRSAEDRLGCTPHGSFLCTLALSFRLRG